MQCGLDDFILTKTHKKCVLCNFYREISVYSHFLVKRLTNVPGLIVTTKRMLWL